MTGRESRSSPLLDPIRQSPNSRDVDVNHVADGEREIVGGDDAGAGEEDGAGGEAGFLAEPSDQIIKRACHVRSGRASFESGLTFALDDEAYGNLIQGRHVVGQGDDGAQSAAMVID